MRKEPREILILKPGAIGDLLHLTPAVRAIKERFPSARVSILVGSHATEDLFRHNPRVHETIVFEKRGAHRSFRAFSGLWRRLRGNRYDLVLNYQRSNVKLWLLVSAAAPCRVLVYRKARKQTVHAVANHLEPLAPMGIRPDLSPRDLEFYPGPDAERFAEDLLRRHGLGGRLVIGFNPGASHPVNRWGTDRFARLADLLSERFGAGILVLGSESDVPLAEEIAREARTAPIVLAGKTDLLQLGAVLKRCAVAVSGDTGPMHLATAVGTQVVALFGAADPERTGPVGVGHRVLQAAGVPCVPCRSRTCRHVRPLECMERISVEEVFAAVAEMVGAGGSGAGKASPGEA